MRITRSPKNRMNGDVLGLSPQRNETDRRPAQYLTRVSGRSSRSTTAKSQRFVAQRYQNQYCDSAQPRCRQPASSSIEP